MILHAKSGNAKNMYNINKGGGDDNNNNKKNKT